MNGGPSPRLGPHPVFEITLTAYDNQTVGWQVTNLVGEVSDEAMRNVLITAARHVPAIRQGRPPTLPDRGLHERS